MSSVQIGQAIPAFSATATNNTVYDNANLKGKHWVLYFYPKDSTPGCTTEGQNFRDLYPQFQACNTEIIGVSPDSMRKHDNFKAKQAFPFELISDPDNELSQLFEVYKLKKMYGREYMGIERSTFLVDANGVLQQEWRKVKVKGHADEVLEAAQNL